MNFDPTSDYYNRDISNNDENILYMFGELIKTLITMKGYAQFQSDIIGIGAVADEMAEDFNSYFTLVNNLYSSYGLLNDKQLEKLNELDIFLDERSGDNARDFWNDLKLASNPDWEIVRKKAKEILDLLGMGNISIEFDRKEKYKLTLKGRKLVMQSTHTRLIASAK